MARRLKTPNGKLRSRTGPLTGPDDMKLLKVAGPGSVRIEENDSWCKYTGHGRDETGFFSEGFAKHTSAVRSFGFGAILLLQPA